MRWQPLEYVAKGLFLGLIAFAALKQATAPPPPDWSGAVRVGLGMAIGLAAAVALAALRNLRALAAAHGRLPAFVLFLLLENPELVTAGLLLGLAGGAASLATSADGPLAAATVGGGLALGIGLALLRLVRAERLRLGIGFVGGATLAAAAVVALYQNPEAFGGRAGQEQLGIFVLLGLPFFYLLTFVGRAEESEVELAALCAAMAVGVDLVRLTPNFRPLAFLLPATVYFVYATRVLNGLRVFKLCLRGQTDLSLGRLKPALVNFRRARELDPSSRMAREGLWALHRSIDLDAAAADPDLLELLDLDMCLDRAAHLLTAGRPTSPQLAEAGRLLDLVAARRPDLLAEAEYFRTVAAVHAGQIEDAAGHLTRLLDPGAWPPGDPSRRNVLLAAWQLALTRHGELTRTVGEPQLPQPGRRMEAIAAVERYLADTPGDAEVWSLKQKLYQGVTEAEYEAAADTDRRRGGSGPPAPPGEFGHAYALELGLALLTEPERWRRGAEYLRMAARGLPQQAVSIGAQLGQTADKAGDRDTARGAYLRARDAGRAAGVASLPAEERAAYFAAVRWLADEANARNDLDAAIENERLYLEFEGRGIETYRRLADLYERKGDALTALHYTDTALAYPGAGKDADLMARKDRYFYSLMPDEVRQLPDEVRQSLDFDYCVRKVRSILGSPNTEADGIEWASHLAGVAVALRPTSAQAQVAAARAALRRGERQEALQLLEDVRIGKPERFASSDEEDAWYQACQTLGQLYLDEYDRPDLAVEALNDFRKSPKSGADTLYHLGRAYEKLGDTQRACRSYKAVTVYDGHPLVWEARDAMQRLGCG
jgi:tetratricopeptide (TPR) repeat protein